MKWGIILVLLISLTTLVLASDNAGNEELHDVIIMFEDGETLDLHSATTRSGYSVQTLNEVVPGKEIEHVFTSFNGISGKFTTSELENIRKNKKVKAIEETQAYQATLDVSVPLMNSTLFQNVSFNGTKLNGTGVTVCILDTGIDDTHAALNASLIPDAGNSRGFVGWDYVNDDDYPYDDQVFNTYGVPTVGGHGTHVAGIVGSRDATYPGIAPGVNIIPIKVLNASGGTTVTPFLAGIEWCVNNATRFNISVISISIGGSTYISVCDGESIPSLFVPVINEAVSKNITVMVSAGNDYSALGLTDPACIANATSVGRTNDDDTISSNSKTASFLDFLAPGTGIISTKRTGGFTSKDGTSMSTPHVAATVALLQQYYHKYYGRFTDTETIKAALNASGPKINDTRLGLDQEFTRVDVYGAYEALITDAPVLAFIDPTPANGSGLLTLDYTFNVSINDTSHNISYCYLTFNSTRYVMGVNDTTVQNATCNVSVNLGMPEKGNYSYYVTGLDDKGELGISETWQVEVLNTPPTINNVSEYGNLSSKETELLTLTVNVSDFNGDTLTFNWLLNETSIATTQNLSHTFNHSQAATYWNLTLNVSDGENYTTQVWNVSVNNTNRLPVFNNPTSYVVNESQMINITLNVTDNDDDDTLTYGTNASLFTQNVNDFNWTTNYTDAGTYSILFNVTDGTVVVNQTVTLTVNDKARLNANSSNITSSVELNIFVNGSLNDTELTEVIALNLTDTSNNTLITFDWNFSSANMSVDIDYVAGSGTLIVRGLDLSSQSVTKTVYVNKSTSTFDYVCVVDKEVDSIATLSSDCSNANETNVPCPGTNGAYSCAVEGSYFKVSGLNHSAIKGMTTPAVGDPGGSGTGGSGGGDDSDDDVLVVCQEDWICEGFKECIDEKLTRRCFDGNNCGTTLRQPLLEKECVEETYQTQEPEVEPTPEVVPEVVPEVKKSGFQQVINNIGNWFKNLNKEKTDTEEVDSNKFNLEGKGQRILLFLIGIFAFLLVMLIVWKR